MGVQKEVFSMQVVTVRTQKQVLGTSAGFSPHYQLAKETLFSLTGGVINDNNSNKKIKRIKALPHRS